jgi:hypothetical protein
MRSAVAMVAALADQLSECEQYTGLRWKKAALPMEVEKIGDGNVDVVEYVCPVSPPADVQSVLIPFGPT